MEKKQTAVEWLVEQYLIRKGFLKTSDIEQAKAMEKEQIKDAYWDGGQDVPIDGIRCEQYYKETYSKIK